MVAEAMREEGISLRKSLRYSECSRQGYYHQTKKRSIPLDLYIVEKTKQIALQRPLYETRRMATDTAHLPPPGLDSTVHEEEGASQERRQQST